MRSFYSHSLQSISASDSEHNHRLPRIGIDLKGIYDRTPKKLSEIRRPLFHPVKAKRRRNEMFKKLRVDCFNLNGLYSMAQ